MAPFFFCRLVPRTTGYVAAKAGSGNAASVVLAILAIFRGCGGGGCDMAEEAVKAVGSYDDRVLYGTVRYVVGESTAGEEQ